MHLTCDEICELLDAYRKNELSDGMRKAVEAHLFVCSACREELALSNALSDALPLSYEEYPEHLHEDVMSAVRAAAAKERHSSRHGFWIAARLAACLLLAVLAIPMLAPFFSGPAHEELELHPKQLSAPQNAAFGVYLYAAGDNVWESRSEGFASSWRFCYAGDIAILTVDGRSVTGNIAFEEDGTAHLCLRDQRIFRIVPTEDGLLLFPEH